MSLDTLTQSRCLCPFGWALKLTFFLDVFPIYFPILLLLRRIYIFACLSVCMHACPSVRPSICLYIVLLVCLSADRHVCLAVYICMFVYLHVCLSVCVFACMSLCTPCLSACLSIHGCVKAHQLSSISWSCHSCVERHRRLLIGSFRKPITTILCSHRLEDQCSSSNGAWQSIRSKVSCIRYPQKTPAHPCCGSPARF